MKLSQSITAAIACLGFAASAQAAQFVQNGGFETGGNGLGFVSGYYSGVSSGYAPSQIADWTAFGGGSLGTDQYNGFSVNSANANALDPQGVSLTCAVSAPVCTNYGTISGSEVVNNTLQPGAAQADPNGGYFVTLDGDPYIETGLSQTITNLKVGSTYTLTFDWGAVDRVQGNEGPYTANVLASFCAGGTSCPVSDTFTTPTLSEPHFGFSGWLTETATFTATAKTEVLSFLAQGSPAGLPPSAVLDGVSLTGAIPEPATWAMMLSGFAVVGALARRRRAVAATA